MAAAVQHYAYTAAFTCLGPDCPDTCCRGWDMPTDAPQLERYRVSAPELLAQVDPEQHCMRKDEAGNCASFEGGLCALHRDYGADFLGDACHFYPRIVRRLGEELFGAASLSCPETARLLLALPEPLALIPQPLARLPAALKDPSRGTENAGALVANCLALIAQAPTSLQAANSVLQRVLCWEKLPAEQWLSVAESTANPLPAPHTLPTDPYALCYALVVLATSEKPSVSPRLAAVLHLIQQQLGCRIDPATRDLTLLGGIKPAPVLANDAMMKRWLQAQIAINAFPFGRYAAIPLFDRAMLLFVRFAMVRLALACSEQIHGSLSLPRAVEILQPIARVTDHLADPGLFLQICRDAGWRDPARLQGLLIEGGSALVR